MRALLPMTWCGLFCAACGASVSDPADAARVDDTGIEASTDTSPPSSSDAASSDAVAAEASADGGVTCVPPPSTCPSVAMWVYPFDITGKCIHCATRVVCAPEFCADSNACVADVATGALHWMGYRCTAYLSEAGLRPCTADEVEAMGDTRPVPLPCTD